MNESATRGGRSTRQCARLPPLLPLLIGRARPRETSFQEAFTEDSTHHGRPVWIAEKSAFKTAAVVSPSVGQLEEALVPKVTKCSGWR